MCKPVLGVVVCSQGSPSHPINQSILHTQHTPLTTLQELGYYRQLGKLVRAVAAGGCYTPLTGAQHTN
jgi:hypothetical protein